MLVSIRLRSECLDESLVLAPFGFCFSSNNKTERVISSIITLSDYSLLCVFRGEAGGAGSNKSALQLPQVARKLRSSFLAQYLGKTDPTAVKGAISDLQERVASLERKLAGLGRLIGQVATSGQIFLMISRKVSGSISSLSNKNLASSPSAAPHS